MGGFTLKNLKVNGVVTINGHSVLFLCRESANRIS